MHRTEARKHQDRKGRKLNKRHALPSPPLPSTPRIGSEESVILPRAWCNCMEHYYGIWMAQDSWAYVFTAADHAGYVPSDALVDYVTELDPHPKR